jgi:phosphate starvation-inducible PhoH-like protein
LKKKKIQPRSPAQADYIKFMQNNEMVFGIGPAGTGKTYLAIAMAVSFYERGLVERIILTRPALEAGERIGFLPGEMKEKMDPYMRPLYDALHDTMGSDKLAKNLASEEIEIAPLAFMRGRSLNDAFIILDEAQNTTSMQMLMFLTRMGNNSRIVVTGDPGQIDLPKHEKSGLIEAMDVLHGVEEIKFSRFSNEDIVRNRLVGRILDAYDQKRK